MEERMAESKIRVEEKHPVQWSKRSRRTLIAEREPKRVWKKPLSAYRDGLVDQLRKLGAMEVLITYNEGDQARIDPGVAVYFSKARDEDYSWQQALGIDSPAPTLAEIDDAYRKKAMQYHPDREGGDVNQYVLMGQHRDRAKAWIKDVKGEHQFVLALDRYTEVRWNVNGLRLALMALRKLEELGLPTILEAALQGFRTAIEDKSNGKADTITV
jgi:hypothetical protein